MRVSRARAGSRFEIHGVCQSGTCRCHARAPAPLVSSPDRTLLCTTSRWKANKTTGSLVPGIPGSPGTRRASYHNFNVHVPERESLGMRLAQDSRVTCLPFYRTRLAWLTCTVQCHPLKSRVTTFPSHRVGRRELKLYLSISSWISCTSLLRCRVVLCMRCRRCHVQPSANTSPGRCWRTLWFPLESRGLSGWAEATGYFDSF